MKDITRYLIFPAGILTERLGLGTKGFFAQHRKNSSTSPARPTPEKASVVAMSSRFQSHPSIESANTISSSSLQDLDETEFTGSELAQYMGELNFDLVTWHPVHRGEMLPLEVNVSRTRSSHADLWSLSIRRSWYTMHLYNSIREHIILSARRRTICEISSGWIWCEMCIKLKIGVSFFVKLLLL